MEFAASVVLTILFIFSIAFELPPIFSFYKFGENIKASYEIAENTPPIPHAESLTLKEFSELVLELSPEEARKTIIDAGYRVESVDEIIEDIAHNNDITPNDLLSIFKSTNTTNAQTDNYSGLGRKTLLMVCEDLQLDPDSALVILDIAEIEIENFEESIKSIAERAGINPIEIIKILED